MLVRATAEQPSLIPSGSLVAQIADRLWGSAAWLIWEQPPEATSPQGEGPSQFSIPVAAVTSGRTGLESLLDRGYRGVLQDMVGRPEVTREQLVNLDFSAVRTAVEFLLPELKGLLERLGMEGLGQELRLDSVELVLLTHLRGLLLPRRRDLQTSVRDPLALDTLVERLGMPAERVQSAMAGLFLKLLSALTRR